MKSILNTIDILLGHLLAFIMNIFLHLILFIVAVIALLTVPNMIFEGSLSLNELDFAEVAIVVSLGLVSWRFFKRGRQLCISWWQLTRRFVFVLAITLLVVKAFEYALVFDVVSKNGAVGRGHFNEQSDVFGLFATILIILAVYAAAPLPTLWNRRQPAAPDTPEAEVSSADSNQPLLETPLISEHHVSTKV